MNVPLVLGLLVAIVILALSAVLLQVAGASAAQVIGLVSLSQTFTAALLGIIGVATVRKNGGQRGP